MQAPGAAPKSVGWEHFREQLLAAGANPAYASEAWARNHYRWVVLKLARAELLNSGAARPPLLTADVVMDELRVR